MQQIFRNSQSGLALKQLRFLSSTFTRIHKSGQANKAVLSGLIQKIAKLVKQLERLVHGKVIRKALGATILSVFLSASIQAQNFSEPQALPTVEADGILVPMLIDIDADGDLDISGLFIESYLDNPFFLIENTGTPEAIEYDALIAGGVDIELPEFDLIPFFNAGDMDNDGDQDLISYSFDYDTYDNIVLYYENLGSNAFAPVDTLNVTSANDGLFLLTFDLNVVDLDADGDLDIVGVGTNFPSFISSEYATALAYWENQGTSEEVQLAEGRIEFVFPEIRYDGIPLSEIADFDNDGDVDVLLAIYDYNSESTIMSYVENNGTGFNDPIDPLVVPSDQTILTASGDIDNDGDIDILYEIYYESDPTMQSNLYWLENQQLSSVEDWTDEEVQLSLSSTLVVSQLILNIELQDYTDLKISIIDGQGAMLKQRATSLIQDNITFDVGDLPAGIYYVNVASDNRQRTLRFVKS